MSLVNEKSPITLLRQFELFKSAPVQTTVENIRIDKFRPIAPLNTGGHIEIELFTNNDEYVKLDSIYLYVKFRVKLTKQDRTAIVNEDWHGISTINNILHSLFNQVDLSINDEQITTSLLTYSQKSYFNNILFSTPEARQNILKYSGFYKDSYDIHDDQLCSIRSDLIRSSDSELMLGKWVELSGRPYIDILQQNLALIGGTKLKFKFVLNRPEFIFMTSDSNLLPQIEFNDVYLEVPRYVVSEEFWQSQRKALMISPANYPINRFEVRSRTIDKGVIGKNFESVIKGQLPKKIYVAFVENEAFNGSFTKNPFNYKHFNLNSIACFVNGKRTAFTPDYSKSSYLEEYMALMKVTGQDEQDNRMGIDPEMFKNGHTIYAFNLSQDNSDGFLSNSYTNIPIYGSVRFEVNFAKATANTINIIFFCDYDNQVSVSHDGKTLIDF